MPLTSQLLEEKLRASFTHPEVLVTDLTGTNNHFEVRIRAPEFRNLNRIKCHRLVMDVFKNELASGELHALAITTLATE